MSARSKKNGFSVSLLCASWYPANFGIVGLGGAGRYVFRFMRQGEQRWRAGGGGTG